MENPMSKRCSKVLASALIGCALVVVVALNGCSLDVPKSSNGIRIIIDDPNKNAALAAPMLNTFDAFVNGPHLLSTGPAATSDFSCFAVNVTGTGISADSKQLQGCTSPMNMRGAGIGAISNISPRVEHQFRSPFLPARAQRLMSTGFFPLIKVVAAPPEAVAAAVAVVAMVDFF